MKRIKCLLSPLLLLLLITAPAHGAEFEQGFDAYRLQNYEQAFAAFKSAAENGDSRAYGKLGAMYLYGRGTEKDPVNAYIWFGMAALSGDKYAPRYRDAASALMTSEQVYQAEQAIADMQDKLQAP